MNISQMRALSFHLVFNIPFERGQIDPMNDKDGHNFKFSLHQALTIQLGVSKPRAPLQSTRSLLGLIPVMHAG